MARPKKPIEELKHPRKLRKSLIDGERITDKPSARLLKNFVGIAQEAEALVWANPVNSDNTGRKNFIQIKWTRTRRKPKDFMRGTLIDIDENGYETRSYSAEFVLLWLWQRGCVDKNPRMIYAMRQKHLLNTERFINSVLDMSQYGL